MRLIEEENEIRTRNDVAKFRSIEILNYINQNYADVSVLIFTASNKVWNHQKVRDAGAVASFIKESPDFGINNNYTIRSYYCH